ncbi:hypothetical protein TKK_0013943 [Trichogramma kaykai]
MNQVLINVFQFNKIDGFEMDDAESDSENNSGLDEYYVDEYAESTADTGESSESRDTSDTEGDSSDEDNDSSFSIPNGDSPLCENAPITVAEHILMLLSLLLRFKLTGSAIRMLNAIKSVQNAKKKRSKIIL